MREEKNETQWSFICLYVKKGDSVKHLQILYSTRWDPNLKYIKANETILGR
jgi:hypothetical protein